MAEKKKWGPVSACSLGIAVGSAIISIGFMVQDTTYHWIGDGSMAFGADFYTEMYQVTRNAGQNICSAINDLICAIGWLIVALGAIDVCYFAYRLALLLQSEKANNAIEQKAEKPIASFIHQSKKTPVYYAKTTPVAPGGHTWRCTNCGNMISEDVCPICRFDHAAPVPKEKDTTQ